MKSTDSGEKSPAPSKRRTVKQMNLPRIDPAKKVLGRSHQRAGVVGGGTTISSGNLQVTCAFGPSQLRMLKLAATQNGVSMSEMVRQCVEIAFSPSKQLPPSEE